MVNLSVLTAFNENRINGLRDLPIDVHDYVHSLHDLYTIQGFKNVLVTHDDLPINNGVYEVNNGVSKRLNVVKHWNGCCVDINNKKFVCISPFTKDIDGVDNLIFTSF